MSILNKKIKNETLESFPTQYAFILCCSLRFKVVIQYYILKPITIFEML